MCRIITLTTDFGVGSPYVAAMKGVILSINPDGHDRRRHARHPAAGRPPGALVLARGGRWFPPGTIHVAVVDPGVGTDREDRLCRGSASSSSWPPTTGC